MALGALAAVVSLLNILLGIVPCTARIVKHNSQSKACSQTTTKQTNDAWHAKENAHQHRNNDGQKRRYNHLLLSALGRNLYATTILGSARAIHNASNLAELTANLVHHLSCGTTHRLHTHGAEEEGHHSTNKETAKQHGVEEREVKCRHKVAHGGLGQSHRVGYAIGQSCWSLSTSIECSVAHNAEASVALSQTVQPHTNFLHIGSQKSHGRKGSRANGKALTSGSCCVAQTIQSIGALANLLGQTAHLSIATSIVRNGTKSVGCQGYAKSREHANGRKANAIDTRSKVTKATSEAKGSNNGRSHNYHREPC